MKVAKYIFLILGITVWAIGLSPALLLKASHFNLVRDGYQYGDLYRLCNLSQFRDPVKACTGYTVPTRPAGKRKVHLYIVGDSFTEKERIGKDHFAADEYTYVHWDRVLHLRLDTTQTNILLLESVERHLREKMASRITALMPDTATFVATAEPKMTQQLDAAFSSKNTEDRLDMLLFQNDWMLAIKQWKADFNRAAFGRVNSAVTLVNDGADVVYFMDTDTSTTTSSFTPLGQAELDTLVFNINADKAFAQSLGFTHVILSVIPNKVSVVSADYGPYNNLIERIYNHPDLKTDHIDVLPEYRKMGRTAYLNGDSHWTCAGQQLWLDKVNNLINQLVTKPKS
jgi:hypothetical protein